MYMNWMKLLKMKKELATLIHAVRLYNQDIGMEIDIEKIRLVYNEKPGNDT